MTYDFSKIEKKWQKIWEEKHSFECENHGEDKFYALIEFPYPSGQGLHIGHCRPYTALDVLARKRRLMGQNVLFPMGWDAFGLPAENYAIQNKIHPSVVTKKNVATFKNQSMSMGYSFDWTREINTTDPNYYKWTQWIFIQMLKRGLAYKSTMPVNWCTKCKVVLANEEVINGGCERCDSDVIRKEKSQWVLKITEYAERLLNDLDGVDYPERVKASQRHWIGKSVGATVNFKATTGDDIEVFTTRADTLFGATYMVLAPEHPFIKKWEDNIKNIEDVRNYQADAAKKSDFERAELVQEKTGIKLDGVSATNPLTGKKIPIFISDYVIVTYGTGAIMAVPAHDTRDYEFAKKFGCEIIEVVSGGDISTEAFIDCDSGTMVNSGFLNNMSVDEAKTSIIAHLEKEKLGTAKVNYRLRDWIFSRQRYWGEPIPVILCDCCGVVPLDESDLPLVLPETDSYEPSDTGESPLAKMDDWVNVICPKCGKDAKRETDTMPQWAGSSWYFLRYMDPTCTDALASPEALNYWKQVDWYNGGMEHTTLHLLYSRFWHKFLYDIGVVKTVEPYAKRTSHGYILGENGEKMSKSKGNIINPTDYVESVGADTTRLYIMFLGDFEKTATWNASAVKGCSRFLEKVWNLRENLTEDEEYGQEFLGEMHRLIKKVGADIEILKFNTAIAAIMTTVNKIAESGKVSRKEYETLLTLLNPFAPHITEELWQLCDFNGMVASAGWPKYDEKLCVEATINIIVQVNGKLRDKISMAADISKDDVLNAAKSSQKTADILKDVNILKEIYVPGKLINFVVK